MEDNQQNSGRITPEQLEMFKQQAKEMAVAQFMGQQQSPKGDTNVSNSRVPEQNKEISPGVIYVRRNLTVAELLLILLISCGIVTGIQTGWNFISTTLPRIEIKVK
ncbi:MAG: hypothetical protein JRF02_03885 [Deltaproteobacteria bacterium]|jgi:hypothetical protein|nr:hypothetical protein [Deltaproteobacteria bacterium]